MKVWSNLLLLRGGTRFTKTLQALRNLKKTLKDTENELEKLNNDYKKVKKESVDCNNNLKIMEEEKYKLKEEKDKLKEENINNKEDIYWLLVVESIIKFLLINSDGLIRRGG